MRGVKRGVNDRKNREFWMDRNVFVTGATGFIGSWITKTLVDLGANVSILVVRDIYSRHFNFVFKEHSKLENIILGDLTDFSLINRIFNQYEVDTCIHLAAQTIVGNANTSPLSTFECNIKGTWGLLEAARNSNFVQRIVVASSDKAYGEPMEVPIPEGHPLMAAYPYGASKACAELLARTYFKTYGLPVAITRCANVYGGGDLNFSRIVPGTIRSVLVGENPLIRSDGKPVRDYMYITDAVNAYLVLVENLGRAAVKGEAFNFGTGNPTSVLDLVERIIISGNIHLKPVIIGKGSNEISVQYLSSRKAKAILGWEAKTSLNDGLAMTFKWYKENLPMIIRSKVGG